LRFGGIIKEEVMRQLGTLATMLALLLAGDARYEERTDDKAVKKELQQLQGTWATPYRATGWFIAVAIDGSSVTLDCVNDAECLWVRLLLKVEVRKRAGKQVLALRNLSLPPMRVGNLSVPGVTLPGVSLQIPYRLRADTLVAGRGRLTLAGVPLLGFRVPGGEMRRGFRSPKE
jgi:hypothetical protein